jgi:hypothetical protein
METMLPEYFKHLYLDASVKETSPFSNKKSLSNNIKSKQPPVTAQTIHSDQSQSQTPQPQLDSDKTSSIVRKNAHALF